MTAEVDVIRKALAAACGDVREASDVAGLAAQAGEGASEAALVALPGSTDEAAAVMRVAAEHELAVVARGAGTRLSWGVPASRCDLVVDTSRLSGVVEHSHGDLVARVRAGARMKDVQAALAQAGQEIALDVPGEASVGGVIASGLAGPRRLRYGTPRDLLIGITIVRADGTIAKSGGKVVKNVAGYDLGKLFAGSAGTLGLITEATFRLHPLPAARAFVTAEYVAVPVACDAVAAAANSPLVPSAVELSRAEPGGPISVGVLLEGSADGVAARAARMAGLLGTGAVGDAPPAWWPGAPDVATAETLIRVSFWVSALGRVLDAIEAAATAAGVSPVIEGSAGAGVLYVRVRPAGFPGALARPGGLPGALARPGGLPGALARPGAAAGAASATELGEGAAGGKAGIQATARTGAAADRSAEAGSGSVAEFAGALRSAVAGERGAVAVLAAPQAVRAALARHGGMNGAVPGLALMRAVKDQFDPGHRLSPGRFPEGL